MDQKWRTPTTFRPMHLRHTSLRQADVGAPSETGKSKKQSSKRADPVSGSNTDIVDLSAEGMMASMSEAPDTHMSPGR